MSESHNASSSPNADDSALVKKCPRCGATFTCGAGAREFKCWCAEFPALPVEAINSEGCLCRDCLLKGARV